MATKRQKKRKAARTASLTRKGLGLKTARKIANGKKRK
jgi:hypothetical protein